MSIVLSLSLVILVVAAGLALVRLQRGPTNLDRAVALDVVTSITIGVVVIIAAAEYRLDLLPLLVVLTSVGFMSSTAIARFARRETPEECRILTPAEAAALDAQELAHEAAWVDHDEGPGHHDAQEEQ